MKQKQLLSNKLIEINQKKSIKQPINQQKEYQPTFCQRCGKRIFVWTLIKKQPMCCECFESMKQYFERRDNTQGKDIQSCSCCKRFKEVGFRDTYQKGRIVICETCLKIYAPYLLLLEIPIKLNQRRLNKNATL